MIDLKESRTFEEEQLRSVAPYFISQNYPPGTIVLKENKINTRLFFLLSGAVTISVHDITVMELSDRGQVFGEMSLANHSTCTATVSAKIDCDFLIFDFEEMRKKVDPRLRDGILKNIYKGAMEILAAKLLTNTKQIC